MLWYQGFFTITIKFTEDFFVLAPKIHQNRCLLQKKDFLVNRKHIKKSSDLLITFDTCFDTVCDRIVKFFGPNWLCPQLLKPFKEIYQNNSTGKNYSKNSFVSLSLFREYFHSFC